MLATSGCEGCCWPRISGARYGPKSSGRCLPDTEILRSRYVRVSFDGRRSHCRMRAAVLVGDGVVMCNAWVWRGGIRRRCGAADSGPVAGRMSFVESRRFY
jgi:hypothetical protein